MPAASSTSSSSIRPRLTWTAASPQCRGSALKPVVVERDRDIGEFPGFLQHDALKRETSLSSARSAQAINASYNASSMSPWSAACKLTAERKRSSRSETMPSNSRGLVGDQAIERLGRDAGAARHGLHIGRGIAFGGERLPRRLVNDRAGLVVRTDLRTAPAAPGLVRIVWESISAMLLHDAVIPLTVPR